MLNTSPSRKAWLVAASIALAAVVLWTVPADAAPPSPETDGSETFICPAVSLHNQSGRWVIGAHGAYYINLVTRGGPQPSMVFVKVDAQGHALDRAQVPAGYALYNEAFPDAFNDDGSASSTSGFYTSPEIDDAAPGAVGLLGEGIANWLGDPAGWQEGDMATVEANGDGTYTVTNLRLGESVTTAPIPLAAGVFW